MDALISLLNNYLTDDVVLQRTVVAVVAVIIFVFVAGISVIAFGVTDPVRRRLGILNDDAPAADGSKWLKIMTAIGPVAIFARPKEELELHKTQQDLYRAGYRSPQAVQTFFAMKAVLTVTFALVVMVGVQFFPEVSAQKVILYTAAGAALGLLLPNYILSKKLAGRMKLLRNGFPDALDLLVVCVESGLGLGPAIQRVADEISVSHPELSLELATVNAEMRAGMPREEALRNLADRTGLPDIRGLVGLLVQSMRFGTSIADALRIYSEEFRDKRMQAAEEQAAKIGTRMIFPLVLCMFPVFFVVAVGPAALRIIDSFGRLS